MGMLLSGCTQAADKKDEKKRPPAVVEAAVIEHGPMEDVRSFSGTLEAFASFTVAPKIGGRIEAVLVDIGDPVEKDAVVVHLDDDEYKQALARAQADLLVAEANLAETRSAMEIAERTMSRAQTLKDRGVASEADLDDARTLLITKKSQEAVFSAQVTRARAALKTAKIQVGYAKVAAQWQEKGTRRVVAERFVDEGQTVVANTPLLRIVDLDPVTAVFFVTEKDYAFLSIAQSVQMVTDAFPTEKFEGKIERIAPVFEHNSRQARVEVTVPNTDERLKPGMFVTAQVMVSRVDAAVIVPADALVTRDSTHGLFIVDGAVDKVVWRPVKVGIRNGNKVQVTGEGLRGRVVTLGQQLLENGSAVVIGESKSTPLKNGKAP